MLSNFWNLQTEEHQICSRNTGNLIKWIANARLNKVHYDFQQQIPIDGVSASEGGRHNFNTLKTPIYCKKYG